MRVFLAGATGVIGRRLIPQLLLAGHNVTGASRSAKSTAQLAVPGLTMVDVDVFDCEALMATIQAASPEVIIDQLTDLRGMNPERMDENIVRNARLRRDGTANLVRAAVAGGVRRMIAQSIAWAYAPTDYPHTEEDALDTSATGLRKTTVDGVLALENAVLHRPGIDGVVLRYGQLYGESSGVTLPNGSCPVHVDAAAHAALLATTEGLPGAYNIAEANRSVSSQKAIDILGWNPAFRFED